MEKSRDAFRTISEVAGWLDVPTHVLRFWESRFSQIKPVKRAGGRRYYRPSDMSLIGGIKTLLHDQGMTIRGVQKMLREQGDLSANAFVVDAVDTTAAGDTFIGYFMAAFSNSDMSNDAAQQALVRGCGASALAVTRSGAAPSIPTSAEVDAFLAKQ